MGGLPVVLLLCSFHALAAVAQTQQDEATVAPGGTLPENCREEMYPCTRMYSVHRPIKRCIGGICIYRWSYFLPAYLAASILKKIIINLPRVYVINKEICMRTVCQQDEYLKAELCRERSGWPRRVERSTNRKRCRNRRSNPKTWANKA